MRKFSQCYCLMMHECINMMMPPTQEMIQLFRLCGLYHQLI